jgi:hypothetical protein
MGLMSPHQLFINSQIPTLKINVPEYSHSQKILHSQNGLKDVNRVLVPFKHE